MSAPLDVMAELRRQGVTAMVCVAVADLIQDEKSLRQSLDWALGRIRSAGLGCGAKFEAAEVALTYASISAAARS